MGDIGFDTRHAFIVNKLSESYGEDVKNVEVALLRNKTEVDSFFEPNGPPKLIWFYQSPQDDGSVEPSSGEKRLFLTTGDVDGLDNKAVYFIRNNAKGVAEKSVEQDVSCGEIQGGMLETLRTVLTDVFLPIFKEQQDWGKSAETETAEFLDGATKFGNMLSEVVNNLQGGVELKKPEKRYADLELKPNTFNKLAQDPEATAHFEAILEDWCVQTEKLLEEDDSSYSLADESGPDTEIEFWRNRMAKLNSVMEQLKLKECKMVLGVSMAARFKSSRQWKAIDVKVTDATNEAKDNVKYLNTLEKSLEPLYKGTPHNIIEALPTLMNNIKMMHTIARYYNTTERLTMLFKKITNKMIHNCRQFVQGGPTAKLWGQPFPQLVTRLQACLALNEGYQEQYYMTRDKLLTQPKGKQFDFNESAIFSKFDLFCRRIEKLSDMFSTVEQARPPRAASPPPRLPPPTVASLPPRHVRHHRLTDLAATGRGAPRSGL